MNVFPPVADLLPHAPPMIVVDSVTGTDDGWVESMTTVTPDHPLFEVPGNGLPGWALIELMAQTVALYAGLDAKRNGGPVRVGYLLGTRRMILHRALCKPGEVLHVLAKREFDDPHGISVYECTVSEGNETIATARINVYQVNESADDLSTAGEISG